MKAIACRTDRIQMKKNMSLSLFPWPWAWIVAGQGCYFGCRLGIAGLKQIWSCNLSQSESDWLRFKSIFDASQGADLGASEAVQLQIWGPLNSLTQIGSGCNSIFVAGPQSTDGPLKF